MTRRPTIHINCHRATHEQIADEIFSLLHGTGPRPYPLTPTEVAKTLGVSRDTIYRYIKKMKGDQTIQKISGKLLLPKETSESKFYRFNASNPITSQPLVAEWIDDLLTRKGGEQVKSWRTRLRSVESVCNTCSVSPKNLLVSEKHTEMILRQYVKMYRLGNATRDKRGMKFGDTKSVTYRIVQGIRDFCRYYGMIWPRGTTGIMSQKVPNHGKYGDIRLTEDELNKVDEFLKEQFGIDSDIYRWFWIGVESCARLDTLYHMNLDHTKYVSPSGKTTYVMTVIESKTQHIRGGKWFKYMRLGHN